MHIVVEVDFVDALGAVIPFGGLLHLHFGGFHGVAFANHRAEVMVAREARVGCHEQVAEVHRVADVALAGAYGAEEFFHLADGV